MLSDRILAWSLAFAMAFFPTLAGAQSPIRAFPPGTFQSRGAIDAAGGGGGVTFSLAFADSRVDAGTTASITYNAGGDPSCGTADPNRYVVVVMGRRISSAIQPTSVTIAGVSATEVSGAFNSGSSIQQSDIWYAAVPTGTTCSVVVAWDSGASVLSDSAIGVYRLITAHPTPTASANATAATGAVTLPAYTVPSGGASVNGWSERDNTGETSPFVAWTNTSAANGDFFNAGSNGRGYSSSTVLVAGSVTVSADRSPAGSLDISSMSAAAWGP